MSLVVLYCLIGVVYVHRLWKRWPPAEVDQVCVPGVVIAVLVWPILAVLCEAEIWHPPFDERK